MDQPPPPPPPHGQNPKSTSSGLPPGNYDIFIIPPHSSGSGFLYLPSLKPNVNSFAAGFASALILVVVGMALGPLVQNLCNNVEVFGGVGIVTLVFAVAVGAWTLGRTQIEKETQSNTNKTGKNGSSGASGSSGNKSTHSSGQSSYSYNSSNVPPSGAGTTRGSGTSTGNNNRGSNQSHWNRSSGEAETAKGDAEPSAKATRDHASEETKKREQERREYERKEKEKRQQEVREQERREQERREQERREQERREKERQRKEQERKEQERKEQEKKEQERREQDRREQDRREQERREREKEELKRREEAKRKKEELEKRLKELREKDARERAAREQKIQEEVERAARAKIQREQEERDAALKVEEALAAKKRELEAKLREEFEAKRNEERAAAAAAALAEKKQKEEEDRLRRRREYEERVKKKKAEEEAIRILEEAKRKFEEATKRVEEEELKKKREEEEKKKQEIELRKKREEEFKKRLEEIKRKREEDAKKKVMETLQPRQSTMYAFTAGEKTNPWPNGRPVSPNKTTSTPSMPQPTPTKSTSQPSPTKGTFKKSENSSTSYQAPKEAQRKNSLSSLNSRSSHGLPKSSPKTKLPSMSKNNIYRTKDQNKIVIKAVYSFNNAYLKNPITQLVSGVGSVTHGLILRMTTEGLFIDDDIRNVPQREWDVKAWTMKLVELWCPSCQDSATTSASMRPAASPSDMKSKRQTMRRLWGLDKDKTATSEEIDALLSEMLSRCQNTCHVRAAAMARNMSPSSSSYSVSSFGDSAYGGSVMERQTTEKEHHDLIGLHVLRASIRDQEGKKYVFIVGQEESWKIVLGLQRLRKGTQVRALNIYGMSSIEAKNTLEYLGWT